MFNCLFVLLFLY